MRYPAPAILFFTAFGLLTGGTGDLEKARDRQDRAALEVLAGQSAEAAAKRSGDASAQYQAALAHSYLAEVAIELRDKAKAKQAAEEGIKAARAAVSLDPNKSEYHRVLGTLCGQVIPANVLAGLQYGKCAKEEVEKAIQLQPGSAMAWLGRGVGNYYLPPAFGGGVELSLKDIEKALALDPRLAEAHVWKGIALRKANRNAEARKAFTRALELNPHRVWARQQLEKTPQQ